MIMCQFLRKNCWMITFLFLILNCIIRNKPRVAPISKFRLWRFLIFFIYLFINIIFLFLSCIFLKVSNTFISKPLNKSTFKSFYWTVRKIDQWSIYLINENGNKRTVKNELVGILEVVQY